MIIKKSASIRIRLTVWQTLMMALILTVFAMCTYAYVRESLFAQIDARMESNLKLFAKAKHIEVTDLDEIERHSPVIAFSVLEDGSPYYMSDGWSTAKLDTAGSPPAIGRWIYTSPQGNIYHMKESTLLIDGKNLLITTAEQSEQIHNGLDRLGLTLLVGFPVTLLLSLFGGYILAGRILKPLQHITQRARSISAENLSERLDISNPHDELGQLSTILNDAFKRLDYTFKRLNRFTEDAAHELRTPLAVLRSVGEVSLHKPREAGAYREVIGSMLEEVDRLGRLVDGLLSLARAESDQYLSPKKAENLQTLVKEVVECLQVLAEEKNQILTFDATKPLSSNIDYDTVRLALMNLLANAIRFTPEGGTIKVSLRDIGTSAAIDIQDNGPGIAPAHLPHIFERFYRVDASRSHDTGGTGLGLAIARSAVEANNGKIELESKAGQGCLFRIMLPITFSSTQS